ncbi:MAG: hypothetical protein LBL31_05780, partial [Spirochaetaceae bacterium]|nr:hypothetical protein [Spirochaetaceae bacterium]
MNTNRGFCFSSRCKNKKPYTQVISLQTFTKDKPRVCPASANKLQNIRKFSLFNTIYEQHINNDQTSGDRAPFHALYR